MRDIAIRVENLGKQYRIGKQERYRTLRDTLTETVTAPFRWLRNGRSANGNGEPDQIWALKDLSFEIPRGQVVGIIGRNGAGKSTLLKVLSRITEPTEGHAELSGRVGSLLEVGTGFHPELTGRDNIYLNGAILGMHKAEIAKKFDEIVAFAEISRFLDTPVKHYSSGMYMRLAFAVAAHLEPEILVVDEVLAVGDATFQRKCLTKMDDVARVGRTVLFVSHNLPAIRSLCRRAIVLANGRVVCDDSVSTALSTYELSTSSGAHEWSRDLSPSAPDSPLQFTTIECRLLGEQPEHELRIVVELRSNSPHVPAFIALDIVDTRGVVLMQALPTERPFISYTAPTNRFTVSVNLPPLIPGTYYIDAWVGPHFNETFDYVKTGPAFAILSSPTAGRTVPHTLDHGFTVPHSSIVVDVVKYDSGLCSSAPVNT